MYSCDLCGAISKPHEQMKRHIIYRTVPAIRVIAGEVERLIRQEIAKEIPVCNSCAIQASEGMPLSRLRVKQQPTIVTRVRPSVSKPLFNQPVLGGKKVTILGQVATYKKG